MEYFTENANYYMTRGVASNYSTDLIWIIIDFLNENRKKGMKADYLKVFEFNTLGEGANAKLEVVQSQECPKMVAKKVYTDFCHDRKIRKVKLWAISDGCYEGKENITILLPEEY